MGRGIDRSGPSGDCYISSAVTIVDQYDYENDPYGELWIEDVESCIINEMGDRWHKPKEKKWICSDGWSRSEYYVIAEHEGSLNALIVASTDTDYHGEFFVAVPRKYCDNSGMERLAEGIVARWNAKLRESLKPMQPRTATSAWTSARIFEEEKEAV